MKGSVFFFFAFCSSLFSQSTITLIANKDAALGYHDHYNTANTNFGTAPQNAALQIPGYQGGVNTNRGLIGFDLSSIPVGSTIISAKLNLYAYTGFTVSPIQNGHYGNNQSKLCRVTSSWDENVVTWNTQPSVSNVHETILNQSTSPNQDYIQINVAALVQDMVDHPSSSDGFRLALVNEVVTASLAFCSRENPNPSKRPSLFVEYRLPASSLSENNLEQFIMCPNPAQNVLHLSFPNESPNRRIVCVDVQGKCVWKANGENQELELDLSSIAAGMYTIFVEESATIYQAQKFYKN